MEPYRENEGVFQLEYEQEHKIQKYPHDAPIITKIIRLKSKTFKEAKIEATHICEETDRRLKNSRVHWIGYVMNARIKQVLSDTPLFEKKNY